MSSTPAPSSSQSNLDSIFTSAFRRAYKRRQTTLGGDWSDRPTSSRVHAQVWALSSLLWPDLATCTKRSSTMCRAWTLLRQHRAFSLVLIGHSFSAAIALLDAAYLSRHTTPGHRTPARSLQWHALRGSKGEPRGKKSGK